MKPDDISPKRSSSRIKAKTPKKNSGEASGKSNTSAASAKKAPPQSKTPASLSALFQGGSRGGDSGKQPSVGVSPKLSSSRKKSQTDATKTTKGRVSIPPPEHDADKKTLEERKRAALAYAMQDSSSPAGSKKSSTSRAQKQKATKSPTNNSVNSGATKSSAGSSTAAKRRPGRPRKPKVYHPNSPEGRALKKQEEALKNAQRTRAIMEGRLPDDDPIESLQVDTAAVNNVTQSLPNSNMNSDEDVKISNRSSKRTKRSPQPASIYNPLPLRQSRSDVSVYGEDDEYARFMRSLMSDDQSIITFNTLKSIKSRGSAAGKDSVVGSAFETMDEDDVSYQLTSDEDGDDDEEDDDEMEEGAQNGEASSMQPESPYKQNLPPSPLPHQDANDEELMNVFGEIEGLMEEDLEAAVMASLIGEGGSGSVTGKARRKPKPFKATPRKKTGPSGKTPIQGSHQQQSITTPGYTTRKLKSSTTVVTTPNRLGGRITDPNQAIEVPAISKAQVSRLRSLMASHHQLLLQQSALSVRAAFVQKVRKDGKLTANTPSPVPIRRKKGSSLPESRLDTRTLTFQRPAEAGCSYVNDFFGGESPEELSEGLDGSAAMLQDLEQNWKDTVRNAMNQVPPTNSDQNMGGDSNEGSRRLTRLAFTKTLLEREMEMTTEDSNKKPASPAKPFVPSSSTALGQGRTSVFAIRGLSHLKETFTALDNSVDSVKDTHLMGRGRGKGNDEINILALEEHGKACEALLKHAGSDINKRYLPPPSDLGEVFTHVPEIFEDANSVKRPLTKKQEAELRRNKHSFTAGEDNLILRGVNLYGEKEWCLVSDRFLPDRIVNSISQRYNKLCFLIFKANGIEIDKDGKMPPIPSLVKGTALDPAKVAAISIPRAPTTMNVHRWTLEEDIAMLKAVPVMGNAWADISTRLMPHRDRGHIRKRFQVLQRRIPKGICRMNMKYIKRPERAIVKPNSVQKKRTINKHKTPTTAERRIWRPMQSPADLFLQAAAQVDMRNRLPAAQVVAQPQPAASSAQISAGGQQISTTSPAKIFQQAAAIAQKKKRPPVSPIKSAPTVHSPHTRSPPNKKARHDGPPAQSLSQAMETVANTAEVDPETRDVASVLGGFSQHSRLMEEDTKMGVEKILDNTDDWSQASGMQRLIEAGAAESNFVPSAKKDTTSSTAKSPSNGKRKSLLSGVMEKTNSRKRKGSSATYSSPPPKQIAANASQEYPSSLPTSAISFNLGTPGKNEAMAASSNSGSTANPGELTMDPELFQYFMSDKSRAGGGQETTANNALMASPDGRSTAGKMSMSMSPTKMTPLSQFGTNLGPMSGPGDNSLMLTNMHAPNMLTNMHASEFDAVAALNELSNSVPNTPSSKLLNPSSAGGKKEGKGDEKQSAQKKKPPKKKTSFLSQVKDHVRKRKRSPK